MAVAYNPYQLLRILIRRVSWPSMHEMEEALAAVDAMESMNIFGDLASRMACDHVTDKSGRCTFCGIHV